MSTRRNPGINLLAVTIFFLLCGLIVFSFAFGGIADIPNNFITRNFPGFATSGSVICGIIAFMFRKNPDWKFVKLSLWLNVIHFSSYVIMYAVVLILILTSGPIHI